MTVTTALSHDRTDGLPPTPACTPWCPGHATKIDRGWEDGRHRDDGTLAETWKTCSRLLATLHDTTEVRLERYASWADDGALRVCAPVIELDPIKELDVAMAKQLAAALSEGAELLAGGAR